MTYLEKIKVLFMVPKARTHLIKIMSQLQQQSYDKIINKSIHSSKRNLSMSLIVKSYFLASRTINNCTCLPKSIALYQKLRATGYLVEHKFGVNIQDQTLAAHAWVEYQNKPLSEPSDLKQRFKVMDRPG